MGHVNFIFKETIPINQEVARVQDIPEGKGKIIEIGKKKILILNIDGEFKALNSFCAHRGAPLIKGEIVEGQLLCPWHGVTFDVATGTCPVTPEEKVQTYPTSIREGKIWVEIKD